MILTVDRHRHAVRVNVFCNVMFVIPLVLTVSFSFAANKRWYLKENKTVIAISTSQKV